MHLKPWRISNTALPAVPDSCCVTQSLCDGGYTWASTLRNPHGPYRKRRLGEFPNLFWEWLVLKLECVLLQKQPYRWRPAPSSERGGGSEGASMSVSQSKVSSQLPGDTARLAPDILPSHLLFYSPFHVLISFLRSSRGPYIIFPHPSLNGRLQITCLPPSEPWSPGWPQQGTGFVENSTTQPAHHWLSAPFKLLQLSGFLKEETCHIPHPLLPKRTSGKKRKKKLCVHMCVILSHKESQAGEQHPCSQTSFPEKLFCLHCFAQTL